MNRRNALRAATATLAAPFIGARAGARARVAVPLPLTGVQSEVANDLRAGYEMAFSLGLANGLPIDLVWADDRAQPEETAKLVEAFAKDESIVATSGIVGTPHAKAALPVAERGGLPVVGLRSGADELRSGAPGVFHLRASYSDELTLMVQSIAGAGITRLAVVYSDDSFGKPAMEHVRAVAEPLGVQVVGAQPAKRDGSDIRAAVSGAVDPGRRAVALLLLVLEQPLLAAVEQARRRMNFLGPIYAMSFIATRRIAESSEASLVGLGLVSAFPLPRTELTALATAFRERAEAWHRPGMLNSLTAFEGFMYGSVITSALRRAREVSREGLAAALSGGLDVRGVPVHFDGSHVGYRYLKLVYKSGTGVLRA